MSQARNPGKAGCLRGSPPAGPGLRDPPPRLALGEGVTRAGRGLRWPRPKLGGRRISQPRPSSSLYSCVLFGHPIGGRRDLWPGGAVVQKTVAEGRGAGGEEIRSCLSRGSHCNEGLIVL